ncbi:MAG: hypothetical protein HOK97_01965 [Deltaproteobacteria bacterium]|jgi:hypothetical protein|nr:hypothetical protein [Deltaproteobacteria bacterium]MBT6488502.1 hypothetical protein [Deltaproteobacteria bacterium]
MQAKPIRFKRNPATKSRITTTLLISALLCLFMLNQSSYESLLPPFLVATLILSVVVLMRLSNTSQRHYLQIYSGTMLINRSLFRAAVTYEMSNFTSVRRGTSLFLSGKPVVISTQGGRTIRLTTLWLTEHDLNRIQKMIERRMKD